MLCISAALASGATLPPLSINIGGGGGGAAGIEGGGGAIGAEGGGGGGGGALKPVTRGFGGDGGLDFFCTKTPTKII